jgi:hypothetical protein
LSLSAADRPAACLSTPYSLDRLTRDLRRSLLGFNHLAAQMCPTAGTSDLIAGHHTVVSSVSIGQKHLTVVLEKILRSVATAVQCEVEHVIGMSVVTEVNPHPGIGGFADALHGHDGVIGGDNMRAAHALGHQRVQGLDQVGHIPAPDRLCGTRDLEALPGENIFQPIEGQVIGELAGHDEGQQSRPRHAFIDGSFRLGRGHYLRAVALFAS